MSGRPKRQKAQSRKYSEDEFIFDAADTVGSLDKDDDEFKAGGRRSKDRASLRSSDASGSSKDDSSTKQKSKKRKLEDSGAHLAAPDSKRAHLEVQSADPELERDAQRRAQLSLLGDMILKSVAEQYPEAAVAEPAAVPPSDVIVVKTVAAPVNTRVRYECLEKDAVRTPDWEPNKFINQLYENGSPLFELPCGFSFDSIVKEEMHKIVVLLNKTEPSVFFDWGQGFLADGPPYYVYFMGDYEKAKRAFTKALSAINEIYQPAIRALYKRRNPSGDMFPRGVNPRIEMSDLVRPGLVIFGQALSNLASKYSSDDMEKW